MTEDESTGRGACDRQGLDRERPGVSGASPPYEVRSSGLWYRIGTWLNGREPSRLALAAAAAMLLIGVLAGALAGVLGTLCVQGIATREVPGAGSRGDTVGQVGTYASVTFRSGASIEAINALLAEIGGEIAGGPGPEGQFKVRLAPIELRPAARNALIDAIETRTDLVTAVMLVE